MVWNEGGGGGGGEGGGGGGRREKGGEEMEWDIFCRRGLVVLTHTFFFLSLSTGFGRIASVGCG